MDIFGILNEFAIRHGMIDEFGSYESAGETVHQSDTVQQELTELVDKLYEALQEGYDERLRLTILAIEQNRDETYGFNDYELAHIINRYKDEQNTKL